MSTAAPPTVAVADDVAFASLKARLADYVELSKPKIAAMALVTVAVGFLLGARPGLAMVQPLLHTLVGAAVVAAGGSALNHWLERRADAKMRRTANRPLVAGRLHHLEALTFGVTLSVLGVGYLLVAGLPAAALAAALTAVLYVGVYTPLKRVTTWNTVVGAVPGALPPVIGWCGATGGMAAPGWALFAILFVWQLPHFYSIAFMHRDDYARGGMKMLPTVESADGRVTGWATFATALLLVPVTALPFFLGAAGWVYLLGSLPAAVWFLWRCLKFARNRTVPTARSVLRGSLVYLLAVMALFVADGVVPRYFQ
jgi:protoheme IX farnesyltransferase